MDIEQERKKFEAWWIDEFKTPGSVFERVGKVYFDSVVHCSWHAWQAAVARCEGVDDGKVRLVTEGLKVIATIQIGNSDNKLTQQKWSKFVSEVHAATTADGVQTHFFGSSDGTKPWQNACWVVSIKENEVDTMFKAIKKIRKKYNQDSVAWYWETCE